MTALFSIFKLLLKVAAVPVVAILALLVWFCTWLVYVLPARSWDWSACSFAFVRCSCFSVRL